MRKFFSGSVEALRHPPGPLGFLRGLSNNAAQGYRSYELAGGAHSLTFVQHNRTHAIWVTAFHTAQGTPLPERQRVHNSSKLLARNRSTR
jgi:hypothetical protein